MWVYLNHEVTDLVKDRRLFGRTAGVLFSLKYVY